MAKVKLGLVQMSSKRGNIQANLTKALAMANECIVKGAQIIQLPELFSTEYFPMTVDSAFYAYAQSRNGTIITSFQALAKKHKVYIIVPWFEFDSPGVYYNSAAFINPVGELCGVHRKAHIPALKSKEKLYFRGGDALNVYNTEYGKIGILICYERSFPEPSRILALKGADIIFYCASTWRAYMWTEELRTRAMENGLFISICNKTGEEDGKKLCGLSMVIDPFAKVLCALEREEAVIVVEIDTDTVKTARIQFPVFRDRRPDLYGTILTYSEH